MRTTVLARRYLPLGGAIGLLLLIIAVLAPTSSTSTSAVSAAGTGPGFSTGATAGSGDTGQSTAGDVTTTGAGAGTAAPGAAPTAAGGGGGGAVTGSSGSASGAAAATGGGAAAASGGATTGGKAAGTSALSGDTSHCVGGREFDPAIDYFAPPCTPGTPGAPLASNGGATAPGVTPNQVEVVWFVTNYGAVVNAILQAENLYESPANVSAETQAFQNFVNGHYVLWGRKVHIDVYSSSCTSAPPDLQCLIPEMDKIAATYHPFAMVWDTTVCSSCYAELAKDGIVGIGGQGFTDSFSNQLAPYFYSEGESSTRTIDEFAQFWCNQLSSTSNPSRKVKWAGTENNLQNFNGQNRVLGVITPNDADNQGAVTNVLIPALNKGCNDGGGPAAHHYFYSQDPSTAAQQTQSSISAMNTPQNPATTVLCLCDPVAPAFTYGGEKTENYWPEPMIASDQGQDADIIGQSYESGTACSGPPCEFDNAFGLSTIEPQLPQGQDPGYRAYTAGGGQGTPTPALVMDRDWESMNMLASLIENTGPQLTAARMQAAAPSMGTRGGGTTGHEEVGFAPGDYQWVQDSRIVYFDKTQTSPYDGKPGTFVQVQGTSRYGLGQFPVAAAGPSIPTGR